MIRTRYILIVVVVLLAIGGTIFYKTTTVMAPAEGGATTSPTLSPSPTSPLLEGNITISGTVSCLPKLGRGQIQTQECAIGLKTKDGKFYGLTDIDTKDFVGGKISTGMNVIITGEASSTKNEIYDIIGTIKVTNYK